MSHVQHIAPPQAAAPVHFACPVPPGGDGLAGQLQLHTAGKAASSSHALSQLMQAGTAHDLIPQPARADRAGQPLAFTTQLVTTEEELLEVQALRSRAYGHHLPHLAESFGLPDPIDREPGTTVFCARDKDSGRVVGSARVQTNRHAPLQIESSVQLPAAMQDKRLCEITRLSVLPGYDQPVRLALVKSSYLFCLAIQVAGIVAGSRRSLVRQYESLGFTDLFGDNRMVPLAHAGGIEHRVLFMNLVSAASDLRLCRLPAYDFIFRTVHPDITIFESLEARMSRHWTGDRRAA